MQEHQNKDQSSAAPYSKLKQRYLNKTEKRGDDDQLEDKNHKKKIETED